MRGSLLGLLMVCGVTALAGQRSGQPGLVVGVPTVLYGKTRSLTVLPFNVSDYGAKCDGVTDDTPTIQAAITAAAVAGGGVVSFPQGLCRITRTVQVPRAVNTGAVILRGQGMRSTYLLAAGPTTAYTNAPTVPALLLFGSATPEASTNGTYAQQTQYVGMEDMSIQGSLLTGGGSVRGIQFTEAQFCWLENVIIEQLPNSSTGLYLLGSTMTAGLGGSPSAPHTRMCHFINVFTSAIGTGATGKPNALILQNSDENTFLECTWGVTAGLTPGNDSIFAVWIQMGRGNVFVGNLFSGDITANQSQYVAMVVGPPVNAAGVANGSVLHDQSYGDWAEGFDRAVWFRQDNTGNSRGNGVYNMNLSVVTTPYLDDERFLGFGNYFTDFAIAPAINYLSTSAQSTEALTLTGATPDVSGGNVFQITQGGATNVTALNPFSGLGREATIRCGDGNTTYINSAALAMQGAANFTCTTGAILTFVNIGGNWFEKSRRTP